MHFIQLERTFYELAQNPSEADDVEISQLSGVGHLSWTDLVQNFRVVILSEAGSGKTEEIRHMAESLRKESKAAFFLRLEHVAADFEDAFEVGGFSAFEAWKHSGDEGWLLLDSVDEARLRSPKDFELAIRKIGNQLGRTLQRAHIIITSRTTAWRTKTDLAHCVRHLTPPHAEKAPAPTQARSLSSPKEEENLSASQDLYAFKIVTLDELNPQQVECFATAKGAEKPHAFLAAVEKADAWQFTSRPQDLDELIEFWNVRGRIGSRLEIMRNSIERRLSERDPDRAEALPLPPERIREGARLVAAAVTMTKESLIRVPDSSANAKGIPIAEVLPDWDAREQAALLSRPIFDEAIYGAVRFHHRSVREFLTAEWLAELLKRETSRRNIETLLFRDQYGLCVVVPAMRLVLPWLAILDAKICERLHRIAPEVFLEGGDPSRLLLEMRRSILHLVCEEIAYERLHGLSPNRTASQRFSAEDLASDVKELLGQYASNEYICRFLLQLVQFGGMRELLPEVKTYALNATISKYTRYQAFRTLQAVGDERVMAEVRAAFLQESVTLPRGCLGELLNTLESSPENITWLLECLAKVAPRETYRLTGLSNSLGDFVRRSDAQHLPSLVVGLNSLLDTPSVIERRGCEISQHYAWLSEPAAVAVARLIEIRHPASFEDACLAILHKRARAADQGLAGVGAYKETQQRLAALVPAWPDLNRAAFWYEAALMAALLDKTKGERLTDYWRMVVFSPYWRFTNTDFEYLLGQIQERLETDEKLLALSLAFRLYVVGGHQREQRDKLTAATAGRRMLEERLVLYRRSLSGEALPSTWRKRNDKARKRKEARAQQKWRQDLSENFEMLRNNGLPLGEISRRQDSVFNWVVTRLGTSTSYSSAGNWRCVIEEFGENVAHAYRDGLVRFWRSYKPQLYSEGAPTNTITYSERFGLAGLQAEANETADWARHLATYEVDLACRYAVHEINEFPDWFFSLVKEHQKYVSVFLQNEIRSGPHRSDRF